MTNNFRVLLIVFYSLQPFAGRAAPQFAQNNASDDYARVACARAASYVHDFHGAPPDDDYWAEVKDCNANRAACMWLKEFIESGHDIKWPADLTCRGN